MQIPNILNLIEENKTEEVKEAFKNIIYNTYENHMNKSVYKH